MNSLRTDDILGAKPRVRHMPKDLIRERRVAQPYFPNIQPSNPEWNHSGASPNFTKNQLYRNVQYQNNDPTCIPFIPRTRLTKESRYVNYDFSQQPSNLNQEKYYERRKTPPQLMRAASEQRNLPEKSQSPKQYIPKRSIEQHNQVNKSIQILPIREEKQDYLQRRSQVRSRKSLDNKQDNGQSTSRNIFRGLGFNIITNRKYQYEFEHQNSLM